MLVKRDGFYLQCCLCKRFKTGNGWQDIEGVDMEQTSHVYCPKCRKIETARLNAYLAKREV